MEKATSASIVTIRSATDSRASVFSELYEYRQVLWAMIVRNIKLQFHSTYLRYLWAVAQPLTVMFAFVFIRHATSADPEVRIPYPLYIFSGLIFWNYFVSVISGVAGSLKRESGLLKKIYFPRILVPIVPVFQNLVNLGMAVVALVAFLFIYGTSPSWNLLLLPFVILQIMLFAFGLGCLWSAISLFAEDFDQIFNLALFIGLFLSPVLFAPSHKNSYMDWVLTLNPMTGSLMAFRACWFHDFAFPTEQFLYSAGLSLLFVFLGLRIFRRMEIFLVDRL